MQYKILLGVNVVALLLYLSFLAGIMYLDFSVFPNMESLRSPPPVVEDAISRTGDLEGLRAVASLLFSHINDQTELINSIIGSTVFWARFHFIFALFVSILNVFLILKLRKR
ncbi:MAG: hypothetical protein VW776_03200 [Betaproteobacteria bacterium]